MAMVGVRGVRRASRRAGSVCGDRSRTERARHLARAHAAVGRRFEIASADRAGEETVAFYPHTRVFFFRGRPRSPAALRRFPPLAGGFGHETQKRLARFARSLGARRDVVTSPVARRPPPRARPADIGSRAPLAMSAPIPDFNPRSRARQHSRVDAVRLESRSPETAKKASRARRSIARGGAPCHPPGSRSRPRFLDALAAPSASRSRRAPRVSFARRGLPAHDPPPGM